MAIGRLEADARAAALTALGNMETSIQEIRARTPVISVARQLRFPTIGLIEAHVLLRAVPLATVGEKLHREFEFLGGGAVYLIEEPRIA